MMDHNHYVMGRWEMCHDCDYLEPIGMSDIGEDARCGGALTNCRHDLWPSMHSRACPVSKEN